MVGRQDCEDWHPETLLGYGLPHLPIAPLYCPPLPDWARMVVMCPGHVQRLKRSQLTVGILGLLLHLPIFCVLTAEKAQAAGVSFGTQGHLLS